MYEKKYIEETLGKARGFASDFSIFDEKREVIWDLIYIVEQLLERLGD